MAHVNSDSTRKASYSDLVEANKSLIECALIENYSDFKRFLLRRVDNAATAEDILQDFCTRVVNNRTTLRDEKAVIAWLYRVLRSVLVDHYRSTAVRRRNEESFQREQLLTGTPRDSVASEENDCECIADLVPNLRTEYAQVLRRVDFAGDAREDVAATLDISLANLRVRLHRARQSLRNAVIAFCGFCCESNPFNCSCSEG